MRLDLTYDGTDFAGWAEQPGQRTVAGVVRSALELLSRAPVRLVVAGRTDTGVHAAGQVAHADVADASRCSVRALNGVLDRDVRVRSLQRAPAGFDARYGALSRTYAYRVDDGVPDPVRRRDTLAWPRRLDEGLLAAAAEPLLGLHDFGAFCRRPPRGTTIRDLLHLGWERDAAGVLTATLVADAFCRSMVRSLVGALLAAGGGEVPVAWPGSLLGRSERAGEVQVAPAHGLTLVSVRYPDDDELADRARVTRATRQSAP